MADRQGDFGDDPLDRLAARSLAASERASRQAAAPARRSVWPWLLATAAVAFSLGMIANPWFESNVRSRLPGQFQAVALPVAGVDAIEARVSALEAGPSTPAPDMAAADATAAAGLAERIAALEAVAGTSAKSETDHDVRLDRLAADVVSSASATASGQAVLRDWFLVAAARRSVEAGQPLGALEASLFRSLSVRDRSAADALMAWSALPVTRKQLIDRLEGPVSEPARAVPAEDGWWDRLRNRLSAMVQVRDAGMPAGDPETRGHVVAALADNDLQRAMALVEGGASSPTRDLWLTDAGRLLAAEQGLDRLELALLAAVSQDRVEAVSRPPLNGSNAAEAAASPAARAPSVAR